MGWFTHRNRPRFPADMSLRLELLGRHAMDPYTSGLRGEDIGRCIAAFYEDSQADPDGFLTELWSLVETDRGGFSTYGAANLVWECFSERALELAAALPIIDAGIDFKLARGLAGMHLTGYESRRLNERRRSCS